MPGDEEHGREGPRLVVERSCHGCRWVLSSHYSILYDQGSKPGDEL